jgi:hypothetical protein
MPIDRLLKERSIGQDDAERLRRAFNLALKGLHLVDREDPVCEIVASKVIEIGTEGARNSHEIAELAIRRLGA